MTDDSMGNSTSSMRRLRNKLRGTRLQKIPTMDRLLAQGIDSVKYLSHQWVTHVVLFILIIVYTAAGAFIFRYLEEGKEIEMRKFARKSRDDIITFLWLEAEYLRLEIDRNISQPREVSEEKARQEWRRIFIDNMTTFSSLHCHVKDVWVSSDDPSHHAWSLPRSVLYSLTVYTTIGYGNLVPQTTAGRLATVIYAVFGIPFMFAALADIGALLTEVVQRIWILLYVFYYVGRCGACSLPRSPDSWIRSLLGEQVSPLSHDNSVQDSTISTDLQPVGLPSTMEVPLSNTDICRRCCSSPPTNRSPPTTPVSRAQWGQLVSGLRRQDFMVPVWLALLFVVMYMQIWACVYSYEETWSYVDAFYFVFVSLATIGFGDVLPQRVSFITTFLYLITGLALLSMFFNVVQMRISDVMRKARKKLKAMSRIRRVYKLAKEARAQSRRDNGECAEGSTRGPGGDMDEENEGTEGVSVLASVTHLRPREVEEEDDNSEEDDEEIIESMAAHLLSSDARFAVHVLESSPFYVTETHGKAPSSSAAAAAVFFAGKSSGLRPQSDPVVFVQISDPKILHYLHPAQPGRGSATAGKPVKEEPQPRPQSSDEGSEEPSTSSNPTFITSEVRAHKMFEISEMRLLEFIQDRVRRLSHRDRQQTSSLSLQKTPAFTANPNPKVVRPSTSEPVTPSGSTATGIPLLDLGQEDTV